VIRDVGLGLRLHHVADVEPEVLLIAVEAGADGRVDVLVGLVVRVDPQARRPFFGT